MRSVSDPAKILIVVEGEKREKPFLQQLIQLYDINAELYVFHANIYNLYLAMESIGFNGDLRDVLAGLPCMQGQDLDTLRQTNFAYTYLIFDCDAQHTIDKERDKSRPIDEILQENFQRLEKMAAYFINETDPTVGKLYVNYPMMESYRHCDDFFDENYCNTHVCIDDIKHYKEITGRSRLANRRVNTFTKKDFTALLRMNIYKLNTMLGSGWESPIYKTYRTLSEQTGIVFHQKKLTAATRYMDVLNTTLFLLADYYGNRDGFYDAVVAETKLQEQNNMDRTSLPT